MSLVEKIRTRATKQVNTVSPNKEKVHRLFMGSMITCSKSPGSATSISEANTFITVVVIVS